MGRIDIKQLEGRLLRIQKPAQYLGGELNSVTKDEALLRVAISYPDLYEVGMSNNGIKILYELANRMDGVACERVFAAAPDFEAFLREENVPLFTLETATPLRDLSLVGFNIAHELLYTNMLQVLDLGRIPLLRGDREEGDPIVIAGGGGITNPFPLSDFIDAFFIGEGEEGFVEILASMKESRALGLSRHDTLERLGEVAGVLLSHRYSFGYSGAECDSVQGPSVSKRIFRECGAGAALSPLVPNIRVVQDRAVVEISRGCFNLCRFCHAGYFDLPYRPCDTDSVVSNVRQVLANTGYNELTLSSLSIGDYRDLAALLNRLIPGLTAQGVSVSLPSLRVDLDTIPVIETVSDIRKSSLTFAVESGSQEMRAMANKKLREEDLLSILDHVFSRGWNTVKLYFMIGLPGCNETDEAEAIISLLKKIMTLGNRRKDINVTISPFVPKPHTPFQREGQMDSDYFGDAVMRIKRALPKFIKIRNHNVRASMLEGVFSRGDARLGMVILAAFRDGCRLDSWDEHFRYDIWERNLEALTPWWRDYLSDRSGWKALPWQVVSTGFGKLVSSMEKSRGLTGSREYAAGSAGTMDADALSRATMEFEQKYQVAQTLRLRLTKTGRARFIPHIDFVEIIKRALRMAGMPVAFTQGFNKRERLAMGFALPLGLESGAELCDIDMYRRLEDPDAMIPLISAHLPEGIAAVGLSETDKSSTPLSKIDAVAYEAHVPGTFREAIIAALEGRMNLVKQGKKGENAVAFSDVVASFEGPDAEGLLRLVLKVGQAGSLRADSLMRQLAGQEPDSAVVFSIIKTGQFAGSGTAAL
jgi:radical SAM family uncharacterized protein/radical SAM-linked protein